MHIARLPRRLRYTMPGQAEIEYPADIPTPIPEIRCDVVQVEVPPTPPQVYTLWGLAAGATSYTRVASAASIAPPEVTTFFWANNPTRWQIGLRVRDWNGLWVNASGNLIAVAWYLTPGNTLKPRRDLLVGSDRIINPTVDTPCPTWRLTGGNCPPNSTECGDCCLDCAAMVAALDGVTATVLPISTWRKRP